MKFLCAVSVSTNESEAADSTARVPCKAAAGRRSFQD